MTDQREKRSFSCLWVSGLGGHRAVLEVKSRGKGISDNEIREKAKVALLFVVPIRAIGFDRAIGSRAQSN